MKRLIPPEQRLAASALGTHFYISLGSRRQAVGDKSVDLSGKGIKRLGHVHPEEFSTKLVFLLSEGTNAS